MRLNNPNQGKREYSVNSLLLNKETIRDLVKWGLDEQYSWLSEGSMTPVWPSDEAKLLANLDRSEHQRRVDALLRGIGHQLPTRPSMSINRDVLRAQLTMLLEEVAELMEAAGFVAVDAATGNCVNLDLVAAPAAGVASDAPAIPDMAGTVDGVVDISVIVTGLLSLLGVADNPMLLEVDLNNLLKLAKGSLDKQTGKFNKPANHPKPEIRSLLHEQGWSGYD
jgi:predicted HAD superfamily Cof-like phosphohydrolase